MWRICIKPFAAMVLKWSLGFVKIHPTTNSKLLRSWTQKDRRVWTASSTEESARGLWAYRMYSRSQGLDFDSLGSSGTVLLIWVPPPRLDHLLAMETQVNDFTSLSLCLLIWPFWTSWTWQGLSALISIPVKNLKKNVQSNIWLRT